MKIESDFRLVRRLVASVGVAIFLSCYWGNVFAHTLGLLDPATRRDAEELAGLTEAFGDAAPETKGVYDSLKLWDTKNKLSACFLDGDKSLKKFFVKTANEWLDGTSITVDFGDPPNFGVCTGTSEEDIRISFKQEGSWSFIGTDSLLPDAVKTASLNIQTDGAAFSSLNKAWLEETILHEVGHALGLEHEHQSPEAHCDDEFAWDVAIPKIEKEWGWSEDEILFNFKQMVASPRLRTTPYDRKSIMHYALPAWMFKKGRKSRCFISQPTRISHTDRETIQAAYPADSQLQSESIKRSVARIATDIGDQKWDTDQWKVIGNDVGEILARSGRKMSLSVPISPQDQPGLKTGSPERSCNSGESAAVGTPKFSCAIAEDGSKMVIDVFGVR
ncbi:M12 family metallopeptidase [Mesorhizobium sp. M0830]|uniref:M12 family metallopeptidase n=1 Tax=Mesorhizobium sp. M0830 TaxID=2957008 RepID=UPI00333C2802